MTRSGCPPRFKSVDLERPRPSSGPASALARTLECSDAKRLAWGTAPSRISRQVLAPDGSFPAARLGSPCYITSLKTRAVPGRRSRVDFIFLWAGTGGTKCRGAFPASRQHAARVLVAPDRGCASKALARTSGLATLRSSPKEAGRRFSHGLPPVPCRHTCLLVSVSASRRGGSFVRFETGQEGLPRQFG